MKTLYTLYAHTSAFTDTFNDSKRSEIAIAQSYDREKLEEIRKAMESDEYENTATLLQARMNSFSWSRDNHEDYQALKNQKYVVSTSFGELEVPIFRDNYYGDGSLDYFTIEETAILEPPPLV